MANLGVLKGCDFLFVHIQVAGPALFQALVIFVGAVLLRSCASQNRIVKFAGVIQVKGRGGVFNHLGLDGLDVNIFGVPILVVLHFRPRVVGPVPTLQRIRPVVDDVLGLRTVLLAILFHRRFVGWEEDWVDHHGVEVRNGMFQGDFKGVIIDCFNT